MIDEKTVRHIAQLAKIGLAEREVPKFAKELSAILEYVKVLSRYDTKDVIPAAHITGLENCGRSDDPKDAPLPHIARDFLEKQAPQTQNGFVVVPRVIE